MPGRNTDIRKLRHGKEPVFDHRLFLNQRVRTDTPVRFPEATIPSIIMNESIGSSDFSPSIFGGGGSKWWKDHLHKWNFTTDNLVVRGTMWIWELLVNQLRASNGTIIISSAAKVSDFGAIDNGGVSWDLIFESNSENAELQPFAVNDIIVAKRFTMPNDGSAPSTLKESVCTVTAISIGGDHTRIRVNADAGYSDPENGMDFVRIGNTTDASRQGSIVLTSDGIDSGGSATVPYIDIYDGIDSRAKFLDKDYVKVRLGRLDEITSNTNEFGLLTSNLHLVPSTGNSGVSFTYYETTNPPGGLQTGYNNGDTWYNETTGIVWKFVSVLFGSGTWFPYSAFQDETGNFFNAEAPSGDGFYAGASHLGFYKDGDWRVYLDNAPDFFLKGASDTGLWWDYSDAALYIGGTTTGSAYLKASAGTAQIQFYDNNNVNVMDLKSSLIGSHGGISLKNKGMIHMSITNATAISNIHLEKYNQSSSGVQGLQTLYLSNDASANVTANPTNSWVVSKIEGERNSSNDIYGIYENVKNIGAGDSYGIKLNNVESFNGDAYGIQISSFGTSLAYGIDAKATASLGGITYAVKGNADGVGAANYGIYGQAQGSAVNWAGYFASGNVNINNSLFFGSGSDTNLYRGTSNQLKTDDAFYAVGNITSDGTIGGMTAAEMSQVGNINSVTISNTQWGYLGALNQGLTKASDVQFDKIYPGNQAIKYLDYSAGFSRFVFNDKVEASDFNATGGYQQAGNAGITSIGFVIAVGDTITVRGGIITALSH